MWTRQSKLLMCAMLLAVALFSQAHAAEAKQSAKASSKSKKTSNAAKTQTINSAEMQTRFSGNVSWYGVPFHGRRTASGAIFDMNKLTCAHKTLPFGTKVLIENPKNGHSVIVEVTDRGPFVATRIFDLSRAAARELGTLTGGTAFVNCLVLDADTAGSDSGDSQGTKLN